MRLTEKEIQELKNAHKKINNKKDFDRLKCLIYWGKNWSWKQIKEALFISYGTIKAYVDKYREGGIEKLLEQNYEGHNYKLSPKQEKQLTKYLKKNRAYNTKQARAYVKQNFNIEYSEKGILGVLQRIGFVYIKPPKNKIKHIDSYLQGLHTACNYIKKIASVNKKTGIYFVYNYKIENEYDFYGWIHKEDLPKYENNINNKSLNIHIAYDLVGNKVTTSIEEENNTNFNYITKLITKTINKEQNKNKNIFLIYDTITDNYEITKIAETYNQTIELIYIPKYEEEVNKKIKIKQRINEV